MLRGGAALVLRGLAPALKASECQSILPGSAVNLQRLIGTSSGSEEVTGSAAYGIFLGSAVAAFAGLSYGLPFAMSPSLTTKADEAEHGLSPPQHPWSHNGLFDSYDHQSIRRGHQVYQQVCATCHSLQYIHYRDMVGVCYTEDEMKAMAAEVEVEDSPNDEGESFTRPAKLSDPLPNPYNNEQHARYINGGAYPPDLSLITAARHDGLNYVFSLLLGYREPPAGVTVREGLYYNPYFPGGAIAMARQLNDGGVEYDDGTPASSSQQAKDVVTFLAWTATPELDERKLMGTKAVILTLLMAAFAGYTKRLRWSPLKSRRVVVDVVN